MSNRKSAKGKINQKISCSFQRQVSQKNCHHMGSFKLKIQQIRFRTGLHPDPAGELTTLPIPPSRLRKETPSPPLPQCPWCVYVAAFGISMSPLSALRFSPFSNTCTSHLCWRGFTPPPLHYSPLRKNFSVAAHVKVDSQLGLRIGDSLTLVLHSLTYNGFVAMTAPKHCSKNYYIYNDNY